eukprot:m.14189 g.14189  ORF g.14189 m.14189 type:complete len:356 (+) comp25610_c0_seq1:78-1145(+)
MKGEEDLPPTTTLPPSSTHTNDKCLNWLQTVSSPPPTTYPSKTLCEPRPQFDNVEIRRDEVHCELRRKCEEADAPGERCKLRGKCRSRVRPQSACNFRKCLGGGGGIASDGLNSTSQCSLGSSTSSGKIERKKCFSLNNSPSEGRRGIAGGGGGTARNEHSPTALKRSLSLSAVKLPQIVPRNIVRAKERGARKLGSAASDRHSLILTKALLEYHDRQQQCNQETGTKTETDRTVHVFHAKSRVPALQDRKSNKSHVRNKSFGSEVSQSSSSRKSWQTRESGVDKLSPTSIALNICPSGWASSVDSEAKTNSLSGMHSLTPGAITSSWQSLLSRRRSIPKATPTTATTGLLQDDF